MFFTAHLGWIKIRKDRGQRSEVGGQRSEVGGRRSEVGELLTQNPITLNLFLFVGWVERSKTQHKRWRIKNGNV